MKRKEYILLIIVALPVIWIGCSSTDEKSKLVRDSISTSKSVPLSKSLPEESVIDKLDKEEKQKKKKKPQIRATSGGRGR